MDSPERARSSGLVSPPFVLDQLAFLDLASLIVFPALVILGIYHARNLQLHARYIVCTVLLLMPPALTCALFILPSMRSFRGNVHTSESLIDVVLVVLILADRRRGKIWAPYPLAFLVFTAMAATSNYAKDWAWWHRCPGGSPVHLSRQNAILAV